MNQQIIDRLAALRAEMAKNKISAVIIPQTDPHQSEYIADHWQVRRYMSGFTGSAGTLVVTTDEARLWVDSRYFLQGAAQLADTPIILMKDGLPGTPSIEQYLTESLSPGERVGIDGMLFSIDSAARLRHDLEAAGLEVVTDFDVIDRVWSERPPLPKDKIFVHDVKYAGESAASKLDGIRRRAADHAADSAFVSALDEIAWALNIRSRDVKYNPVATAYLYVSPDGATLLTDPDKVDDATAAYLADNGVEVKPYDEVKAFITNLSADRVLVERARTSVTLAGLLGDKAVYGPSPIALAKGCKNDVQIAGFKAAMVRDGVALVKAFKELDDIMATGGRITEMGFDALLLKHRSAQPLFFDESFGSIVGYGPHGAIVHYEATAETDVEIEPHGLLLVDSGAQYLDGTTDITRTIAMGEPTDEERHDFTLVLKGCIALDEMVFPVGTRGVQLDVEARKYLWREGLGYLHGTGHGIGHFLNVHEGPQSIRTNENPVTLHEGMVTSDEPGLYREGVHGIRCENLVLTVKAMTTEFGEFLRFETLTLFPFDTRLLELSIMTADEIAWINNYHDRVYAELSPYLDESEKTWLKKQTAKI